MHESPRRARQRELARAQRSRSVARHGLHTLVLAAIAGGTVAFAGSAVPPAAGEGEPSAVAGATATATAFGAVEKIDRAGAQLVASRFESRAPIPGVAVELAVDGEARELTTTAATVAELLLEAGVAVDNDDVVSVPLGSTVEAGLTVTVTTVHTSDEQVTETDEFETVEEPDDTLLRGQRRVVTEGVDGVTATTYRVTTEGGQETSREVVARAVRSERVDEVVRVGTREPVVAAPRSSGSSSAGSASASDATAAAPAASAGNYSPGSSKAIAAEMVAARGWGDDQFQCLETLWQRESNWNHLAQNPSSGAYGIPQSLPGSKMASAGSDWRTNPATQITWGLGYISGRYGTPCGALGHSNSRGWY